MYEAGGLGTHSCSQLALKTISSLFSEDGIITVCAPTCYPSSSNSSSSTISSDSVLGTKLVTPPPSGSTPLFSTPGKSGEPSYPFTFSTPQSPNLPTGWTSEDWYEAVLGKYREAAINLSDFLLERKKGETYPTKGTCVVYVVSPFLKNSIGLEGRTVLQDLYGCFTSFLAQHPTTVIQILSISDLIPQRNSSAKTFVL